MLAYTIAIAVFALFISSYGLHYYAAPSSNWFVKLVVGASWIFCIGMILIVPTDVQVSAREVQPKQQHIALSLLWNVTYWMCFLFTWVFNPIIASFISSADFTVTARMRASFKENVMVYVVSTVVTVLGLLLLIFTGTLTWEGVPGIISAASNVFGLVVVVLLLAYGLVDVPRCLWRFSELDAWSLYATTKIGKLHSKVEESKEELRLSAALANNMSRLISRRDSLRKYADQIYDEIASIIPMSSVEDLEVGDLDLEYELDHEGLVSLRKRCQRASIVFQKNKCHYIKLVKSVQGTRERLSDLQDSGAHTRLLLREIGLKALAVVCILMSLSLVVAEGTLSWTNPDLSIISVLLKICNENIVGTYAMILAFLLYFCSCTYHSLFKMKIFSYYYLVPQYTDSYSLLLNASMLARFTAPLCYNFLTLTKLKHTALTDSALAPMGKVPFFGQTFNTYYPIICCVFFLAVALNFWSKITKVFKYCFSVSSSLDFDDDEEDIASDYLTRGQTAVFNKDFSSLEFTPDPSTAKSSKYRSNASKSSSSSSSSSSNKPLDADARWEQAQERIRKKREKAAAASGEANALSQSQRPSDKLESIFKGLLS